MESHLEIISSRVAEGASGHALYEGFETLYEGVDFDAPHIGYKSRTGMVDTGSVIPAE